MSRSHTLRFPFVCLLALSLGAGCFFGDDKDSPSDPAGDTAPPEVVDNYPADGATSVDRNVGVWIEFSEPMNLTSVADSIEIDPYTEILGIEWIGTTMEIHHDILPRDSGITVTIGTIAADLAGNNLEAPYARSFTTVLDEVRPRLLGASPANGAAGEMTSLNTVALTFSEPMNPDFQMPADNLTIAGTVEIEDLSVNLTAAYDPLNGAFRGCYVHHLYGDMVFHLEGSAVGDDSFHMITWYAPGAGPVKIVEGTALGDTSYVYDWEL